MWRGGKKWLCTGVEQWRTGREVPVKVGWGKRVGGGLKNVGDRGEDGCEGTMSGE